MDISHFDLHSVSFEVRYDHAFLFWDRAGALWQAVRKIAPTIKLGELIPARVGGTVDRRFQLQLEIEKILIIVYSPPATVEDHTALCQNIVSAAVDVLELKTFSRIGLRVVYQHKYRSSEEAADALLGTGMMKAPEGKHFGIEKGQLKLPHYAIRLEGENIGVQVNLRAQDRKILLDAPMGEPTIERFERDVFELVYDIDYFTIGTVDIGQFRASEWIPNVMRIIRRDSKVFLGG